MADAADLKSSGDFSSCAFHSRHGHQSRICAPRPSVHRALSLSPRADNLDRRETQGSQTTIQ
jgi:hypothetical protein